MASEEPNEEDYLAMLNNSQKKNMEALARLMPEERARPSLMEPAAGPLLALITKACDKVGRGEDRDALLAALEKGFQDEMDE